MEKIIFTEDQKKAINHGNGHLRIVACAGSGKTEVVSRRIANLIKNGVQPKNIVAFTFTEKAADELKMRIRQILDEECPDHADFGDMYIGTIHSFCFFMLKEIEPTYKSFDVLDEAKRVAYVAKKMNFSRLDLWALGGHHKLKYYRTIDRFLYSADIMMMENIDPAKLTDKRFAKSYMEYRKMLEEHKYLDFSSMIHTLVTLLRKNPKRLSQLHDRIKHLVVDEYQDINKLQEQLIELISRGAESVCVVGDDDQCIYQWRGSNVENIIGFKDRYGKNHDVNDITIDINFRSTESVIHTAREFIKNNRNRLPKSMQPSKKLQRKFEDGDIIHKHFDTEEEEFGFILKKIKDLLGTDFIDKRNEPFSLSLADFAVLVRTNEDAAKVISFLEKNGIECIAYSGNSVFDSPAVQLAMDCIGYVFGCQGYTTDNPSINVLGVQYRKVFNKVKFPRSDEKQFTERLETIKKDIEKIFSKNPKDYLGELGMQAIYHRIVNAMGAEDFDFGDSYNYSLAVLSQAISDYESVWIRLRASEVQFFFFFVRAYAESHYTEIQYSDPALMDAVKVLTIHKAKGLEFPVVFVPCMVKKRPYRGMQSFVDPSLYNVDKYQGDLEDERRIYYTAMTRSEKYLFLTGSRRRSGRVKSYEHHPFIEEIDKKFFSDNLHPDLKSSGHPPRINHMGMFPTSFSQLTSYDRCPHDFKLRHVFGYNAGVPPTFGYGTNIHNILNVIHRKYIEGNKIPDEKDIKSIFDRMFMLRYATEKIAENMKKSGIGIVNNYVNLHKGDFKYILETEKRFEFVMGDALISGEIDLIKKLDETGKVTGVEIIDFKTEKEGPYQLDYEKQLRLYAIACIKSLGIDPKKAAVHHLDKEKNRKDYVDITEKQLKRTKDEVDASVTTILGRHFPAKPSDICKQCDYRIICSRKGFRTCGIWKKEK